jgi:hypothetical protein
MPGQDNKQYDDELRGVLFHAQKKNDRSPDVSGWCQINGHKWNVAGWKRTTRNGNAMLSLAFSEPQEGRRGGSQRSEGGNRQAPPPQGQQREAPRGGGEDLPF